MIDTKQNFYKNGLHENIDQSEILFKIGLLFTSLRLFRVNLV